MARRLRVLSAYPGLGKPNDIVSEDEVSEAAQAYVDAGLAEWVDRAVVRSAKVETTAVVPSETTARRRKATT